MRRTIRAALILGGVGIAACAPATIVRDPIFPPAGIAGAAAVQAPLPSVPGAFPSLPLSALQTDLVVKAGSDTVRFAPDAYLLDDAARTTLAAQADWLRANPMLRANIEGHADGRQTREYAFALGERRASAVHSFLLAQGVSPTQLTVISWGKERPAVEGAHEATWLQNSRVVTVLVR